MHDTNEIAELLHIWEKASAHGTALKNIADAAYTKLLAINADHAVEPAATEDQVDEEQFPIEDEPESEPEETITEGTKPGLERKL